MSCPLRPQVYPQIGLDPCLLEKEGAIIFSSGGKTLGLVYERAVDRFDHMNKALHLSSTSRDTRRKSTSVFLFFKVRAFYAGHAYPHF